MDGADEESIQRALAPYGELIDVWVNASRRFAFATFKDEAAAGRALDAPAGSFAPLFTELRRADNLGSAEVASSPRLEIRCFQLKSP